MNKNNECKIVEDLLYGFNETVLNKESMEFVNNHLKDCGNCRNKIEEIKSNILKEKQREKEEDEIELSYLSKINKVMRTLKISLIILIVVIVLLLGSTIFKSNQTEYVVKNAYNKLEELQSMDNYILTKREIYIDNNNLYTDDVTTEIYYKNGKYKQVLPGSIFFYEDGNNKTTYVYEGLKRIEINYGKNCYKGDLFKEESGITGIYNNEKTIFQKAAYEVINDTFNGINCYVIRIERENNGYKEIWVNKENFLTIRSIERFKAYYRETLYELIINQTLDEDVTLNMDNYNDYTVKDLT